MADHDLLIKLLLIGDSGVGKTSVLIRFAEDSFTPNYVTTIGIDFRIRTIELGGKRMKLQLWDTAGQERYQSITKGYYRHTMGIIVVYDVTNEHSFRNLRHWIRNIEKDAPQNVIPILVGNKCDLVDEKVIETNRGQALADERKMPFFETSAKNGVNVEEAFLTLVHAILQARKIDLSDGPKEVASKEAKPPIDIGKQMPHQHPDKTTPPPPNDTNGCCSGAGQK